MLLTSVGSPALRALGEELNKTAVLSEDFKKHIWGLAAEARREGFNDPKGKRENVQA